MPCVRTLDNCRMSKQGKTGFPGCDRPNKRSPLRHCDVVAGPVFEHTHAIRRQPALLEDQFRHRIETSRQIVRGIRKNEIECTGWIRLQKFECVTRYYGHAV